MAGHITDDLERRKEKGWTYPSMIVYRRIEKSWQAAGIRQQASDIRRWHHVAGIRHEAGGIRHQAAG